MRAALAVFTDGRADCIRRTIASADERLHIDRWVERVIFDDSNDLEYHRWLRTTFPTFDVVSWQRKRGFGGTISAAWRLLARVAADKVFHLEDDFTFERSVEVVELAEILDQHPQVAQVALVRQPWNDREHAAGGLVASMPGWKATHDEPTTWLEHGAWFTTNPSLYRRDLCERGWPDSDKSEGVFTHQLLADGATFGYLGRPDDPPAVTHIGNERKGTGY